MFEKIKFISIGGHVIFCLFCLLHKRTNDDVFDNFPKISDHFPKISEDFPKLVRRQGERFRTFFGPLPKISEEAPITFRSYSNISKYFFQGLCMNE